jgi:ABC-type amino acid transport system permease subunit
VQQFLHTFFSWTDFKASIDDVVRGFMTNLSLMTVAEVCVLVWGLVLALTRLSRSRALVGLCQVCS